MRRLPLVLALLLPACTGLLGGIDETDSTNPPDDVAPPPPDGSPSCLSVQAGPATMRRLTRDEYRRTIADLFDLDFDTSGFPDDEQVVGFTSNTTIPVKAALTAHYMTAAESIAASATEELQALDPCAATPNPSCAETIITKLGRRIYRRPLLTEEKQRLLALHASTEGNFRHKVEVVLRALLQSPFFLYRIELEQPQAADGPSVAPLDPFELAARLSYFLWGSTPDDALLDAAANGQLTTTDDLQREAERMLADPKGVAGLTDLAKQWIDVTAIDETQKDALVFPEFTEPLKQSMNMEAELFIRHVLEEGSGTLSELLTSPTTFVDANTAELYGVAAPESGFERVTLSANERSGLLTLSGQLAVHASPNQSSPILRGKFVRERLLCQPLPEPPEGLMVTPPDPDPSMSTRERFAAHTADPACSGCHLLIDPIGFGFEHYDALGRYRQFDGDFVVDASGEVLGTDATDTTFDGAPELGAILAASDDVRDCFATQVFRFAVGRGDVEQDACSVTSAASVCRHGECNVRDVLIAVATSDSFRYRRAN